MMPKLSERMQVLRDYLVQEAIDKKIPEADRIFVEKYKLNAPSYHPNVPK
jgi:hypothetical protein